MNSRPSIYLSTHHHQLPFSSRGVVARTSSTETIHYRHRRQPTPPRRRTWELRRSPSSSSSSSSWRTSPPRYPSWPSATCILKDLSDLSPCYVVCLRIADQIDARNKLARKRLAFAAPHELTPHLGSVQSMACPLTMAVCRLQTQHERPSGHAIQWAI